MLKLTTGRYSERTENNTARTEHRIYLHKQNSSGYWKSKEVKLLKMKAENNHVIIFIYDQ